MPYNASERLFSRQACALCINSTGCKCNRQVEFALVAKILLKRERRRNMRFYDPARRSRKSVRQYRYQPGRSGRYDVWRKVLGALCLAGVVVSGIFLIRYIISSIAVQTTNSAMSSLYHASDAAEPVMTNAPRIGVTGVPFEAATPVPAFVYQTIAEKPISKFGELLKANKDVIGWLSIKGELDLPVVYKDNEYYLTHDVYKKKSQAGTLFLDENHPLTANAQHLLIHGHNMKDGSMFGHLQRYLDVGYLKKHGIIQFDTLYAQENYVIYAVLIVPESSRKAGYINYQGYAKLITAKQFADFVEGLKARSKISIPINLAKKDALLTLSTCHGDDRLIVALRRLRPNETAADVRQLLGYAFKP